MDGTSFNSAGSSLDVHDSPPSDTPLPVEVTVADLLDGPEPAPASGHDSWDPGCETIKCLSEIRSSERRLIFIGEGKRQDVGLVEKVINSDTGYAVWVARDDPYRIHCMMTDAYVARNWRVLENAEKVQRFHLLWNEVSMVRNEIRMLEVDDQQTAKIAIDLLGNAVGAGLELDTEAMANGVRSASAMVYNSKKRIMKIAYTKAASWTAIAFLIASTIALAVSASYFHDNTLATWVERVCIGMLGGTLGATISVLSSFNAGTTIDIIARTAHASHEGSSRIMFGIMCGLMAMLAVSSGLIFGGDVSPSALLLLSAVGGYAEKFVPNILTNIASSSNQDRAAQKNEPTGSGQAPGSIEK